MSRNSPFARAALVDYAPFGMWTRAATKFVFWTLPAKHPIKLGIAALAYEMTQTERDALGLSHFSDNPVPPNAQGSIPLSGGRLLAPQSISSFGFFADYQQSLANTFLPQLPLAELAGLDWTGTRLTQADGTPATADQRVGAALLATGEAFVPFFALTKRVAEDGPSAILPRSVKPYDAELVNYLRSLSSQRKIGIPAQPATSSDAPPWAGGEPAASGGSVDVPWTSGGTSSATNPVPWAGGP